MKRLLLIATLLASLLAVALSGPANAVVIPCHNKVFNDWLADGKIASTYPVGCYRDALNHMPVDAGIYSSLGEDIRAAMRAATRRTQGLSAPSQVGHGFKALGTGSGKGTLAISSATPHDPASSGVVATASSAPLPILVLGGIALALAAAGAIGVGVRHARGRKPR